MDKLNKGLKVIHELSAITPWPASVTPMAVDEDGTHGFWPKGFSSGAVEAGIKYSNRKRPYVAHY